MLSADAMDESSGVDAWEIESRLNVMTSVGDQASFAPLRIQELAGVACVLNILDSLGYGSFLVDRERQVLAHNKIARDCLDDGLTLSARRLAATDRESDIRLQSSIGVALTSAEGSEGRSVIVQRRSRLPLALLNERPLA
jgi:hypothetical protein